MSSLITIDFITSLQEENLNHTILITVNKFQTWWIMWGHRSQSGAVGIATRILYGQCGVWIPAGQEIFRSSKRTEQLWVPPNILCNCYRRFFMGVKRQGLKFTTQLHLISKLKISGTIPQFALRVSNKEKEKSTFYLIWTSRQNIYCLRHNELFFCFNSRQYDSRNEERWSGLEWLIEP